MSVETTTTYYLHKLREGLSERQKMREGYSMRAYARDLGVHPATLNQVLLGRRSLPMKDSKNVADRLKLGPIERTLFFESFLGRKSKIDEIKIDENSERFILDESYYRVIAEWEHYAVLTLMNTRGYVLSEESMAERLGLTATRAKVVLQNLVTSGLIKIDKDGRYVPSHKEVRTTEDVSSQALRESHLENLDIGKRKLEEVDVLLRDYSSLTVAVDLKKLTEAKTIIREFRNKMDALLKTGNKTEVFQLAIQFYPLTQIKTLESTSQDQENA